MTERRLIDPVHRLLRRLLTVLTTWPFLASLATLLLNDFGLKAAFPGVITGKLSDFAGVAVLGLLVFSVDSTRLLPKGLAIGLAFAWWKSPLSQSLIDAVNASSPMPIGRVVDFSDLIALAVLLPVACIASRPSAFQIPGVTLRRVLVAPVAALTLMGLMATSVIQVRQDYQVRRAETGAPLDALAVAKTLTSVAEAHGLRCDECSEVRRAARYQGNGMTFEYWFVDPKTISLRVFAQPNGMLFGPSGGQKADRLRASLKAELARLHQGLEYVERLDAVDPAR